MVTRIVGILMYDLSCNIFGGRIQKLEFVTVIRLTLGMARKHGEVYRGRQRKNESG